MWSLCPPCTLSSLEVRPNSSQWQKQGLGGCAGLSLSLYQT